MIRGGVPQSVAMRVTGHRSDSMFRRCDVASVDDKLEAIQKARAYAATRTVVGGKVAPFPMELSTLRPHIEENGQVPEGSWLGGRNSNPKGTANPRQSYANASGVRSEEPQ